MLDDEQLIKFSKNWKYNNIVHHFSLRLACVHIESKNSQNLTSEKSLTDQKSTLEKVVFWKKIIFSIIPCDEISCNIILVKKRKLQISKVLIKVV